MSEISADLRAGGNMSGQFAVGREIHQTSVGGAVRDPLTAPERTELDELVARLREQVRAQAPAEQREDAEAQVDDLADQVAADPPDVNALKKVVRWFRDHLPALGGAVRTLVLNPLVSKVVATAGDAAADEFGQFLRDIAH